ncbi:hypothetical protein [Neorhizobium huautlense]
MKLAEALDDRASFRRLCGFSIRADAGTDDVRALPRCPDHPSSGRAVF